MKNILATTSALTLAVGLLASAPASANTVTYTTPAAFAAATTGATVETYTGITPAGTFTGVDGTTLDGISYSGGYAYVADPAFYPPYYDWGTGAVLLTDLAPYSETLSFAPTTAFAADFGSIVPYGDTLSLASAVGTFSLVTQNYPTLTFFGFTSDTAFSSVTISAASGYPILDNVTLGTAAETTAVPEPVSMALLGTGLAGLGLIRRKRAQ